MIKKTGIALSVMAVLIVMFTAAFRTEDNRTQDLKWYRFEGGSTHSGENEVSNYELLPGQNPESEACSGETYVCLILAPEGSNGEPDLAGMTDVFTDSRVADIITKN